MTEIDKENQQKGVKFQFRKRYRKVDWKLLASIDVERIARDLDYHALQANIMNVAFCDTKCQDFLDVDEDFIKLYRLGQYTIEYLLHCQEYLSHGAVELENKLREAIKFRNEVKEKLESKQKELTDVKKESRKRKKMISVYQGMLNQNGANGFHKCTHCEKAFVSAAFLASHLERRHGIAPSATHNNEDKLRIENEELQTELDTLKLKLTNLESHLSDSRESRDRAERLRDTTLQQQMKQDEAHRAWEDEVKGKHERQVEEIKAIYMKEATDALEGKRIAELALVEAKRGIVSNLGALRDEKHEHDELRQEQIQQIEERFEFKLSQLQKEMTDQSLRLRNQEDSHRSQIKELAEKERRLTKQLEDKIASERRLTEILEAVEIENAKLQHHNKQKPDIRSTFSPGVLAQMNDTGDVGTSNVEVVQTMLATQPVTLLQDSTNIARNVSQDKSYSPFSDKPFINTYYNHSSDALKNFRDEMKTELSIRMMNMTAYSEIESLSTEEYGQYKEKIDRNRVTNNTTLDIKKLDSQINEMCTRSRAPKCSPSDSPRGSIASPILSKLPPKSPSFKTSRDSLTRPNSSKRSKPSAPAVTSNDVINSLTSPSLPNLSSDKLVASTPKINARSADNIAKDKEYHQELDFDDDTESLEKDVSEIEMLELEDHVVKAMMTSQDRVMTSQHQHDEEEEDYEDDDDLFVDDADNARQPATAYSLRDPNYNPLDEESEEDELSRSPSPEPAVKRRPPKSYSRDDDDSIFSFDGWSRMKNRNSMSADDAQQNIPLGHVAKMRQAVDELNKQKRGEKAAGVGFSVIPPSSDTCPVGDAREEEDDFTISSLSERDVSPVGSMKVKVDIKRSSRNGVNNDGL